MHSHKKVKYVSFAAALLVAATVAPAVWLGLVYLDHQRLVAEIPEYIRNDVNFGVYIPTAAGYSPKKDSYQYAGGVLQYVAGEGSSTIVISEQAKPADFDLNKYSTAEGLASAKQVSLNGNAALLGTLRSRDIAIIDTGASIVTVTGTASSSDLNLEKIVRSLRKP